MDVGTRPAPYSILELWRAFHNDKNLGGACGEIHAMLGKNGCKLLNPIVAAQNFEYKVSSNLDQRLDSIFGYIRVLPDAFSAYRYRAIVDRPSERYFNEGVTLASHLRNNGIFGTNIFKKNMLLAEDRILSFEVVAKEGAKWRLKYVKTAKAETNVPEHIHEFVSRRSLWINESFAGGLYAFTHFSRIMRSSHSIVRKIFFFIQAVYHISVLVFTWFNLVNAWLTFIVIIDMAAQQRPVFGAASDLVNMGSSLLGH